MVITLTSKWARWRLKSPASQLFTQPFIRTQIKENIKAPRHWSVCGEFTGDRWIPRTNGQSRGKGFHLMTSSCEILPLWRDEYSQLSYLFWRLTTATAVLLPGRLSNFRATRQFWIELIRCWNALMVDHISWLHFFKVKVYGTIAAWQGLACCFCLSYELILHVSDLNFWLISEISLTGKLQTTLHRWSNTTTSTPTPFRKVGVDTSTCFYGVHLFEKRIVQISTWRLKQLEDMTELCHHRLR